MLNNSITVGRSRMLWWALVFFIVAIVAAIFGFGGIAAGVIGFAKILFWVVIILFLISVAWGLHKKGKPKT
jgi:uncharacterized membrane protein YtjA (UPF0391 family)